MKRTLLIFWTVLAVMVVCLSCREQTMSEREATEWIAAYAPERISVNSPIRIEFTDKVAPFDSDTRLNKC